MLVPHPDVLVSFGVNDVGDLLVQQTWPAGVAAGLPVLAQFWIVDGAALAGLAASNGVEGVTGS